MGAVHAYHADPLYYEGRADGLLASAQDGTDGAVAAFARMGEPLTGAGARAVVAAEHGCDGWAALLERVAALDASDDPFVAAYRAVEAHDVEALRALLDAEPGLVHEVGTNGNDLLGMAASTCDERVVALLLARGADVAHGNAHGWTALHQAASSGLVPLTTLLLEAGAPVDVSARGDGGTPLIVALFWGQRGTAEVLAPRGVVPRNLRAAAGLGSPDLLDALLGGPGAGDARAFYRPHGGFPAWTPSDDPQEVLDEALAWAARNDRVEALRVLARHGARPDADVYRGTALAWAAATGRVAAIGALVALGADPDARTTFGGPQHGQDVTALHLAAQGGRLDAIRALLDAGADPALRDALYDSPPAGWAEHGGARAAAELLRAHGG